MSYRHSMPGPLRPDYDVLNPRLDGLVRFQGNVSQINEHHGNIDSTYRSVAHSTESICLLHAMSMVQRNAMQLMNIVKGVVYIITGGDSRCTHQIYSRVSV